MWCGDAGRGASVSKLALQPGLGDRGLTLESRHRDAAQSFSKEFAIFSFQVRGPRRGLPQKKGLGSDGLGAEGRTSPEPSGEVSPRSHES